MKQSRPQVPSFINYWKSPLGNAAFTCYTIVSLSTFDALRFVHRNKRSLRRRLLLFRLTGPKKKNQLYTFALQFTNISPLKAILLNMATHLQLPYWGRNQNINPVQKLKATLSVRYRTSKREAVPTAALLSTTMKKFIVFILVLSLLIAAEYYFLTEFFTQKRVTIIACTLSVIVGCLFYLTRFFRRSYISP